jgi:archaellum component FlaC
MNYLEKYRLEVSSIFADSHLISSSDDLVERLVRLCVKNGAIVEELEEEVEELKDEVKELKRDVEELEDELSDYL